MTSYLPILVLLTVEVTLILATAPSKYLYKETDLSNVLSKKRIPASYYDVCKTNLLQIDPLRFDCINIYEKGLQIYMKDIEYTGFNNAIVDDFSINFNLNYTRFSFHTCMLLKGNYKFAGTLFSKPLSGEGPMTSMFKNTQIDIDMPFEIVEDKKGQKYIKLTSFYFWHDLPEGKFTFYNMYNGDTEKSEIMHSLINQNFRIFCQTFGKNHMTKIIERIYNFLRNQMLSMPLRDFTIC